MKNLFGRVWKLAVSMLMVLAMCPTASVAVNAEDTTNGTLAEFVRDTSSGAGLTVSGVTKDKDGSYTVKAGQEYTIDMNCAEYPDGDQFTDSMTYIFPEGFNVADGTTCNDVDITVHEDSGDYVVKGNSFVVKNNVLTFTFNKKDGNWPHLNNASNAKFSLSIKGTFSASKSNLTFVGKDSIKVIIKDDHEVKVTKKAEYNEKTKKAEFTLDLSSTGSNTDIDVKDIISGTALTLDKDSITSSKAGEFVGQPTGKGFEYKIPSMADGEHVTIKYTASVDFDKLTGDATWDQTANTATVTSKEHTNPNSDAKDLSGKIKYVGMKKEAGTVTDGSNGHKTVNWTVTYNDKMIASAAGRKITDSIDESSKAFMSYTGKLTVTAYKADGSVAYTDNTKTISGSEFEYTISANDSQPYKYVLTYQTDVDMSSINVEKTLKNSVTDDKDHSANQGIAVTPSEKQQVQLTKSATSVSLNEISWAITLTVPMSGLNKAEIKEIYPSTTLPNGETVYEGLKNGTLAITGMDSNESYKITENKTSHLSIQFFKDKAQQQEGLNSSSAVRNITITLTTLNNQDWLTAAQSDDKYLEHKNTVKLYTSTTSIEKNASAYPDISKVTKTSQNTNGKSGEIDGLPYYTFDVTARGVDNGSFVFNDEFLTSYFKVVDEPVEVQFFDISCYNGGWNWLKNVNAKFVSTSTGATLSIDSDAIPSNANFARFTYKLQVKDAAALAALKAAAASQNDGKFAINNKITYQGKYSSSASSTYSYTGLTKEMTTSDADLKPANGPATLHYVLDVNLDAEDMSPAGDTLVLTDDFHDNQSIVYKSIHISDSRVTYDVSGTVATFTVPDNTHVTIEYDCVVIAKGDSVKVTNDASIYGYKASSDAKAKGVYTGTGTASNYSVTLFKYEKGNMQKGLAGAEFKLYYQNGDPVVDTRTGNQISVTTQADGTVILKGSKDDNNKGWGLNETNTYYIQETTAPAGYKLDDTKYMFKVGDYTDYTKDVPVFSCYDNTLKVGDVALVDEKIVKNWEDDSNVLKLRPEKLEVTLNGTVKDGNSTKNVYTKTVTLSASNNWTDSIVDLPACDEFGNKITYTWAEQSDYKNHEKYTEAEPSKTAAVDSETNKTVETTTLTNSMDLKYTDISVSKTWEDADDQDGVRPASVTFQLQESTNGKDFTDVDGQKKTFDANSSASSSKKVWNYTFENQLASVNGKVITYRVVEIDLDGNYTVDSAKSTNTNIVNVHTPKTTDIQVNKVWDDASNAEGFRPASVTFQLQKSTDGKNFTNVEDRSYTLTSADAVKGSTDEWTHTFTALPQYENGSKLTYRVVESMESSENPEGAYKAPVYSSNDDNTVLTVTNSRDVITTPVEGTKTWNDTNNTLARPKFIMVHLHASNTDTVVDQKVVPDAKDNWSYSFGNLQKYYKGEKIVYSVTEDDVTNYSSKADGMNLINTYTPGKTSVTVTKNWIDQDNAYSTRPAFISVQLYADGEIQGSAVKMEASKDGTWSYTWNDLDAKHNGEDIAYTVKEVNVPDGYANTTAVADSDNNYTLVNTKTTSNLVITKNFTGDLSDSQLAELQKNLSFTVTSKDNSYSKTFNYSAFTNGKLTVSGLEPGSYTVTENHADVDGYDLTPSFKAGTEDSNTINVVANQDDTMTVTNNYVRFGNIVITKTIDGKTITPEDKKNLTFTIDGPDNYHESLTLNDFTLNDDGTYTYTTKNVADGDYTVKETNATIDGYDVEYTISNANKDGSTTAKVTAGTSANVNIKDSYTPWGNLVIIKTFDGADVTKEDLTKLTFEITGPDGTTEVKHLSDFTKNSDGTYTYTLERAAKGEYTVHETNADIKGYDVTVTTTVDGKNVDTTSVDIGKNGEVDITNNYQKLGSLVITKTFDGANITDEDKANLKFEITLPDQTVVTKTLADFTKNSDGTYSYTMENAADGKYSVHEVNPEIQGYDVAVAYTVNGTTGAETAVAANTTGKIDIKDTYTRPETPVTPDQPETPVRPETPVTPDTDRPTTPATPDTGDTTNVPMAAGMMGLAMLAAGLAFFFKKKYSD